MTYWPTGLNQALGDELVTCAPLINTASVYFVHYGTGDDANGGEDQHDPFKTLGHAVGLVATGDTVVLLDGHEETITDALAVTPHGVNIVGAGSSGGIPTVILTMDRASGYMLELAGEACRIGNVRFAPAAQTGPTGLVTITANGCEVRGCYFSVDEKVSSGALVVAGEGTESFRCEECTFLSAATSNATRPPSGLVINAAPYTCVKDCVFDGGTNGFENYGIYEIGGSQAIQFMRISLLRGADILLADTTTGYVSVSTSTQTANVYWPSGAA